MKRIITLCKTLCYQFQKVGHQCSINQKSKKKQTTSNKNQANGRKTAKHGHLYAPVSQKHFSKSISHSQMEAQDQKTSLAQTILVHTAILLFRFKVKTPSERMLKKNLKKTNTRLRAVKKTAAQYNSNSLTRKKGAL